MNQSVPLYKGTLKKDYFGEIFGAYMNAPFADTNISVCLQNDDQLMRASMLLLKSRINELIKKNCKFLFTIIVDRQKEEFVFRFDEYKEPLCTCLLARQLFEREVGKKKDIKVYMNKTDSITSQSSRPHLDMKKECTYEFMNEINFPKEMVIMIIDTTYSINYPLAIQLKDDIFYDLNNFSFFKYTDNRSYKVLYPFLSDNEI